jgi:hypothetical protein
VRLLKKRFAKVNISSAGGTASAGAKTYKVTLPNVWMKELGVDEGSRELEISFDGKQIIRIRWDIRKRISSSVFFVSFSI